MYQTVQVHIAFRDSQNRFKHLALKRSPTQRFYPSIWQTITGKVEMRGANSETFIQTALREIEEETGIKPNEIIKHYNIPYVASFTDYRSNSVHQAPVLGILTNTQIIKLSDEHSDFKWIDSSQFDSVYDLYSHKVGASMFQKEILDSSKSIYELSL